MAIQNDEWVRVQLRTLYQGDITSPDPNRSLAEVRARANVNKRVPGRWIAVAACLGFAAITATVSVATAQRPSLPYLLELEQQFDINENTQRFGKQKTWLRIRPDGVFVRTSENPVFPFLSTLSFIHADGRVDTYLEFLPFIKTGSKSEVARTQRVKAGCQLPSGVLRPMGTEQIQGIDTLKFEWPIEHGRMFVWVAPSLGCAQMQAVTEMRQHNGTYRTLSRFQTVDVRRPTSD